LQKRLPPLKRLAFESPALSYHFYRRLKKCFLRGRIPLTLVPTCHLVEGIRAQKDLSELKAIKRSLAVTEGAFQEVFSRLKPGQTEKEISWRIKELIHLYGGDAPAFEPIVASGPRAALPHAETTDREIKKGEPILFDLGSKWEGYCSDMSRTVFLGKPSERFKEVYRLVREAQVKSQEGIRTGMNTRQVDGLARSVIEKGGYGKYFNHSLGHGVGLATHEIPSLNPVKAGLLRPGMVVTIEPGIYLPGWGGVRLENMVVIRKNRASLLSHDMTFYNF
jgi:Xaa-Pro aminopeptidase